MPIGNKGNKSARLPAPADQPVNRARCASLSGLRMM
ncbi:Uncharacterised protein [Bordetella pertussis]|nr:Uncharacterised protein [Bordetella pertussis]CFP62656.1 Uncharacterised protein [Bordetella pertussis]